MIEKVIYKLEDTAYFKTKYTKNQIVIGNSYSINMEHVRLWKRKLNGNFKGTSPYTISLDGTIHEHYNPEYYSNFLDLNGYDKKIIPILLENEGWLIKNENDNELFNWCGDIYNRGNEFIVNTKWRNKSYWAPYTDEQLNSLVLLTKILIKKFKIPLNVSEHNTKIDDIHKKLGIYYKSNYNINYLDVSPSFNFKEFKNKIENNEKLE